MLLSINEIKINEGRRTAAADAVQALSDSIKEVGMMNPITVTADHTLIAGLHRLEAAKRLGWTEIECCVIETDALHAELAEIDENYVRANLTVLESSKIMLRRKEIYETLHPETRAGTAQGEGMKRAAADNSADLADKMSASPPAKPFAEDTADKLGVDARTVRRQVQIAKDLTPEAQEIIENSGVAVTQQNLIKLSRLEPELQKDAARQLVSGEIKSVDAYGKPTEEDTGGIIFMRHFSSFAERVDFQVKHYAESFTPNFHSMTDEQVCDLERRVDELCAAMKNLIAVVKEAAVQDVEQESDDEIEVGA